MIVLHSAMLFVALIGSPLLLVLCCSRRRGLAFVATATGALCVTITVFIALLLHTTATPITPFTLTAAHLIFFCLVAAVSLWRRPSLRIAIDADERRLLLPGVLLLILVIFPYTTFTGIDTYKWQDLAGSVKVEESLAWLVHPLSLFGFTPRSYPSAYPIQLATIQLLGSLGVEGGFRVASILTALLGAAGAYSLGRLCFTRQRVAIAFSLCYTMSPVFIRYTHWATGRGLFLALLPTFLALLVSLPRLWAWPGVLVMGGLLCLSHKVGLIAAPLFIALTALGRLLPRRSSRIIVAISGLLAIGVGAAIVTPMGFPFPVGPVAGLIRFSITRFGWMIPLVCIGCIAPADVFRSAPLRLLFPCLLVSIPLAFEQQMYGALLALPCIVLFAMQGVFELITWRPSWTRAVSYTIAVVTLVAALGTVVHRSRIATPRAVRAAAQFLEHHDPCGPFRLVAPGRARTQIQAYVSGCPRICVTPGDAPTMRLPPPPPPAMGSIRDSVRRWISYGRGFFGVSELATSWYGEDPKTYYFEIDGDGSAPQAATRIYADQGVSIYEMESK